MAMVTLGGRGTCKWIVCQKFPHSFCFLKHASPYMRQYWLVMVRICLHGDTYSLLITIVERPSTSGFTDETSRMYISFSICST